MHSLSPYTICFGLGQAKGAELTLPMDALLLAKGMLTFFLFYGVFFDYPKF